MTILQSLCHFLNPELCLHCKELLPLKIRYLCFRCELNLGYFYHLDAIHEQTNLELNCLFEYTPNSPIQSLIKSMKYKNLPEVGAYLIAKSYHRLPVIQKLDLVVPIPIHASKRKKRKGNQLDAMGIYLATFYGAKYTDYILLKSKKSISQSEKSKKNRAVTRDYGFYLKQMEQIKDKTILLIDDIVTTGGTLKEAIKILQEGKPKKTHIICIASGSD